MTMITRLIREKPLLTNHEAANFNLIRMEACTVPSATMAGTKRKHGEDSQEAVYANKSRSRTSVEARIDPTYGQRSAIPGLDDDTIMDGGNEELNYDEEMDALAYLRSVRLVHPGCFRSKEKLG